jgi:hypothetical protein
MRPSDTKKTAIRNASGGTIKKILKKVECKNLIFLLGSCHAKNLIRKK